MKSWRVPTEARTEEQYPRPIAGRIEPHRHRSRVLEGNPWGDPTERALPVYVPPSGVTRDRPLLVLLSGYTGSGWTNLEPGRFMEDSIVSRLDRLIRTGRAAECVLVAPDALTSLGGSQYLDSSATGRYETYVAEEIVPWVREHYGTGPTAVMGTSSGGFGAVALGLRHPDVFRAVGSNAGDAYFEYCYPPDFPVAFRQIRRAGGPEAFLRKFFQGPVGRFVPSNPIARTVSTLAYASCYSPIEEEPGRFQLPFDLEDGGLRPEVWSRWLAWDPVRMVATEPYGEAARRLAYVYLDGGTGDEFGLDVSARILAAAFRKAGAHVEHEEFEGGHFEKGPRYDVMIPRLLAALGFPSGH